MLAPKLNAKPDEELLEEADALVAAAEEADAIGAKLNANEGPVLDEEEAAAD